MKCMSNRLLNFFVTAAKLLSNWDSLPSARDVFGGVPCSILGQQSSILRIFCSSSDSAYHSGTETVGASRSHVLLDYSSLFFDESIYGERGTKKMVN